MAKKGADRRSNNRALLVLTRCYPVTDPDRRNQYHFLPGCRCDFDAADDN